jgi:hypothetical protein
MSDDDGINQQSAPKPNRRASIQSIVRNDLRQREQFGIEKYGTPLQANNGRVAIVDAYQEALDLVCYLKQVIEEGGLVGRHGADDTPCDPLISMTPGQFLARLLDSSTEKRLDLCGTVMANNKAANRCWELDHEGQIEELKGHIVELSRSLIKCASGLAPDPETVRIAELRSWAR